jgi:hypothetical protein
MKKLAFIFALIALPVLSYAQVVVNITTSNVTCHSACDGNATAVPTGGTPPYTYVWAPSMATTQSVTNLCAGFYTLTVTDQLGGTVTQTCVITQPPVLTVSATSTPPSTCSACDGVITAMASGGAGVYTYNYNPAYTPGNACAGTYTVIATDANGCVAANSVAVAAVNTLTVTVGNVPGPAICEGSTIAYTSNVTGGNGPYTFNWSLPGGLPSASTQQNPSSAYNTAGSYTTSCTVQDASGCLANVNVPITVSATSVGGTITGSATYCTTTNSGTLILSGHTGNVTRWEFSTDGGLTWTNVANTTTTFTYNNVSVNTLYRARVQSGTCAAAYSATASVNASTPPTVTLNASSTTICAGTTFTLTATSTAVAYTWLPALLVGNPVTFTATATDTYTCIASDINGCSDTATITITVISNPTVTTSETPATCNGTGTVSATASGGNPPYMYLWNPGSYTSAVVPSATPNQTYTVDVTDASGCTVQAMQAHTDSCDYVWPGDANDDAVADNIDILDIGIANGATGTPRANASLTWIGQPSAAWGTTLLSGTDYKWVDCNGDGAINPADTQAVILNYGFAHNNRVFLPEYSSVNPDLSVSFDQDSVGGGNTGSMTLSLGTASNPANNVYGLAFRLNYDPAQISTSSLRFNGGTTWFGTPGSDMMRVVLHPNAAMGFVDVAITRLDQQDVSGSGIIGSIYFTAMTTLNGTGNTTEVPLTVTDVVLIDHLETEQTVNATGDTVVIGDHAVITAIPDNEEPALSVYPNPASGQLSFTVPGTEQQGVTIQDLSGRVVYSQTHAAGMNTISVAALPAGSYILRCTDASGVSLTERITIAH